MQVVSCDPATGDKFALDKAAVPGNQISGATATLSANNDWVVDVTFKSAGLQTETGKFEATPGPLRRSPSWPKESLPQAMSWPPFNARV